MMMIKELNSELLNKRKKPAVVRIDATPKNSRLNFSVEAVSAMNLKPGDKLSIYYDTLEHDIFYLFLDERKGVALNKTEQYKSGYRLGLHCRRIAKELIIHLKANKSVSMKVSAEKVLFNGKQCWFARKYKRDEVRL